MAFKIGDIVSTVTAPSVPTSMPNFPDATAIPTGSSDAGLARAATSGNTNFTWGSHVSITEAIPPAGYSYPSGLKSDMTGTPFVHINVVDPVAAAPRTMYAIALTFPASVKVQYNANWESFDLGFMGRLSERAAAAAGSEGGLNMNKDDYTSARNEAGSRMLYQGAEALGDNARAGIEKGRGRIINNHAAMLFKGMSFREFQLEWNLFPKNANESYEIRELIFQLKYAMHPEAASSGGYASSFFDYPQNFILGFYGPHMNWLFRTSACSLLNLSVEYNGAGMPSFFPNDEPTCVNLLLHFKETEILTKTKIKQGW